MHKFSKSLLFTDDLPFVTIDSGQMVSSSVRLTGVPTPTTPQSRTPSSASNPTQSRVVSTLPTKDALRDSPEENADPGLKFLNYFCRFQYSFSTIL